MKTSITRDLVNIIVSEIIKVIQKIKTKEFQEKEKRDFTLIIAENKYGNQPIRELVEKALKQIIFLENNTEVRLEDYLNEDEARAFGCEIAKAIILKSGCKFDRIPRGSMLGIGDSILGRGALSAYIGGSQFFSNTIAANSTTYDTAFKLKENERELRVEGLEDLSYIGGYGKFVVKNTMIGRVLRNFILFNAALEQKEDPTKFLNRKRIQETIEVENLNEHNYDLDLDRSLNDDTNFGLILHRETIKNYCFTKKKELCKKCKDIIDICKKKYGLDSEADRSALNRESGDSNRSTQRSRR